MLHRIRRGAMTDPYPRGQQPCGSGAHNILGGEDCCIVDITLLVAPHMLASSTMGSDVGSTKATMVCWRWPQRARL